MDADAWAVELLRRSELDQKARQNAPGGRWTEREREQARAVDTDNTHWLMIQVNEHGWPRISDVGPEAAHAAWLLAQHADADPDQQRAFLALMREATEAGEARPADLAYLEDRCRINADQPQLYGTQLIQSDDDELVPAPITDPAHTDQRRAAIGLGPLADYLAAARDHNK